MFGELSKFPEHGNSNSTLNPCRLSSHYLTCEKQYKMKKKEQQTFELGEHPYIELNNLLKIMGWVNSGGEANTAITDGEVMVNDVVETRKRNKLMADFKVVFNGKTVIVKR
jgi:ribosome-associated protein